jgi:Tfp pilus assembly protein PilF
LQAGKPADAIVDLRTALTYSPGTRAYELLLAQALAEAGHTDEAYQYFMGLWVAEPGDGFINLQLARLARTRNDRQSAVNFYRASIYGTWEGDGVARRSEVRLELARFLIDQNDLAAARLELLIAGGNAPDEFNRDMNTADLLRQAHDPINAWTYYLKALAQRPGDPAALEAAGRLAYQVGDYANASRLLARLEAESAAGDSALSTASDDTILLEKAARLQELLPSPALPARERVAHILAGRIIARQRLSACSAQFNPAPKLPSALQALNATWAGPEGSAGAATLLHDSALQDSAVQLIYDTETQTEMVCGMPTGDDALLLRLATTPHPMSLPESEGTGGTTDSRD